MYPMLAIHVLQRVIPMRLPGSLSSLFSDSLLTAVVWFAMLCAIWLFFPGCVLCCWYEAPCNSGWYCTALQSISDIMRVHLMARTQVTFCLRLVFLWPMMCRNLPSDQQIGIWGHVGLGRILEIRTLNRKYLSLNPKNPNTNSGFNQWYSKLLRVVWVSSQVLEKSEQLAKSKHFSQLSPPNLPSSHCQ